jgi:hypothetical protein
VLKLHGIVLMQCNLTFLTSCGSFLIHRCRYSDKSLKLGSCVAWIVTLFPLCDICNRYGVRDWKRISGRGRVCRDGSASGSRWFSRLEDSGSASGSRGRICTLRMSAVDETSAQSSSRMMDSESSRGVVLVVSAGVSKRDSKSVWKPDSVLLAWMVVFFGRRIANAGRLEDQVVLGRVSSNT